MSHVICLRSTILFWGWNGYAANKMEGGADVQTQRLMEALQREKELLRAKVSFVGRNSKQESITQGIIHI